jgi:hypothetical protein
MAKQLVSPIERHVDKAVLGLAVLALIGVIAQFFVTSPNRLEMRGERVTPRTIDEKVRQSAEGVRLRLRDASPPNLAFEPGFPEFERSVAAFERLGLADAGPAVAPPQPPAPLVGAPIATEGDIRLVESVTPSKPVLTYGRSMILFLPDGGIPQTQWRAYERPTNWVTVASLLDMAEQRRRQRERYFNREDAYVGLVETQRRALRSDGTWSEEDWATIQTLPPEPPPPLPPLVGIVEENGRLVVPPDVFREVEAYFDSLKAGLMQVAVMRPMPPDILEGRGDQWSMPLLTSRRDVLMQDDELRYPGDTPPVNPDDRYPDKPEAVETTGPVAAGGATVTERIRKGESLMEQARAQASPDLAIQAYNEFNSIILTPGATSADKERARRLRDQAEQLQRDIERKRLKEIVGGNRRDSQNEDVPKRTLQPIQQVWSHDALADSLASGRTYQYRLRVWIYNRYAGDPRKLAEPNEAALVLLPSPWSEPSDAVSIPPDGAYFLVGDIATRGQVSVEFYRWFEGYWVRPRGAVQFGVGDEMTTRSRAAIPLPDGGVDNPEVEFSAEALVLDIDFRRTIPDRRRTPTGGVRFQGEQTDTVVALVDDEGNLVERSLLRDKGSPTRSELRKKVWQPPREEPEKPKPQPGPPRPPRP